MQRPFWKNWGLLSSPMPTCKFQAFGSDCSTMHHDYVQEKLSEHLHWLVTDEDSLSERLRKIVANLNLRNIKGDQFGPLKEAGEAWDKWQQKLSRFGAVQGRWGEDPTRDQAKALIEDYMSICRLAGVIK